MSETVSPEVLALQEYLAGRYSIERELGRGGMGTVLLARDVALDRLVAIKLLPAELAEDPEHRERFLREARTAAGLSHPNIVPIHAVEEHENLVFFVMGFVDGETLGERVTRHGPVSPRFATRAMQEVAWALGYAHQRGIVHRDIKPDNILIEQGSDRALVTDFGIAQAGAAESTGEIVGTARYMSPEQASGAAVDPRSDLYSLGATFFFALTGRAPFEGRNLPALLAKHVAEPAPSVRSVRADVPDRLADIIDRSLQKSPDDRLQSGDETAAAIGEARGRDFRAPPLVRSFVRNAEVSTMVVLAAMLAGQASVGNGNVDISVGGPGLIGTILIVQLVLLARRLLREGYTFDDIRVALLAEARVQDEEAEMIHKQRWLRRLNTAWHRLWAGRFGRWFFRVSGRGIEPPEHRAIASTDATEFIVGRAATDLYDALPAADRSRVTDAPDVIRNLERRAVRLRRDGVTGPELTATVAALEKVRLALLRVKQREASIDDLTMQLENAKKIGEEIRYRVAATKEVGEAVGGGSAKPR